MKKLLSLFTFIVSQNIVAQSSLMIGNTSVQVDTVFTGLDIPWEITYGPDEDIWVTERSGLVSKINPVTKTRTILLDLSDQLYAEAEAGLLGLALHPDFENNPLVYLAYTYGSFPNISEKIVSYTFQTDTLINETIIVQGIYGNSTHNGARLLFLPDTTLLISTGDVQSPSLSQDLGSLNGKILRVNDDGTIPSNNPDPTSRVYSYGFRNVQGLGFSPTGKIFISEHGASTDDEFQELIVNRNYGWPNVEGFCNTTGEQTFCNSNDVKEPLVVWTPTIAPSDILYYDNPAFPEFNQKMLMTVLKDQKLVALTFNQDETAIVSQTHYLTNQFGRLRDLCVGKNKEIYLATNGASWSNTDPFTHSIIRITPPNNLSLKETKGLNQRIYPNPSKGKLSIPMNEIKGVTIYNIDGKLITSKTINGNQDLIDISELLDGLYLFEFSLSNMSTQTLRIVKN